ncbi:transcriptional regulator domain-containing protein [Nitrosomonas sp.]|uniref:transcriptional regulator domain-containing protein n=1 Tax=Nitrosomonas sp. TaxID=42353 RepID=UPI00374DAF20
MSAFIPPDWRDASAYPEDASPGTWAWEFLRRNPDYQKDYEHFASLPDYRPNGAKTAKWYCTKTWWWEDPELRYCKQPITEDDDTIGHYFNRTGDSTPFDYSLEDHLIEKWGFTTTEIYDPSYDGGDTGLWYAPELPKELPIYDPEIHPEQSQSYPVKPDSIFEITLRFDLRYSVKEQLEKAKKILMSYKEGLKENSLFPDLKNEIVRTSKSIQIEKLPKYLRAYDARQDGATELEIGKEFYPGTTEDSAKQKAHNACKKAKELVYGGYRELMKYE